MSQSFALTMSVCITVALHLRIKKKKNAQYDTFGLAKSLSEGEIDESGGRPGSGSASDETESGEAWHGVNLELMPFRTTADEQPGDCVKCSQEI